MDCLKLKMVYSVPTSPYNCSMSHCTWFAPTCAAGVFPNERTSSPLTLEMSWDSVCSVSEPSSSDCVISWGWVEMTLKDRSDTWPFVMRSPSEAAGLGKFQTLTVAEPSWKALIWHYFCWLESGVINQCPRGRGCSYRRVSWKKKRRIRPVTLQIFLTGPTVLKCFLWELFQMDISGKSHGFGKHFVLGENSIFQLVFKDLKMRTWQFRQKTTGMLLNNIGWKWFHKMLMTSPCVPRCTACQCSADMGV